MNTQCRDISCTLYASPTFIAVLNRYFRRYGNQKDLEELVSDFCNRIYDTSEEVFAFEYQNLLQSHHKAVTAIESELPVVSKLLKRRLAYEHRFYKNNFFLPSGGAVKEFALPDPVEAFCFNAADLSEGESAFRIFTELAGLFLVGRNSICRIEQQVEHDLMPVRVTGSCKKLIVDLERRFIESLVRLARSHGTAGRRIISYRYTNEHRFFLKLQRPLTRFEKSFLEMPIMVANGQRKRLLSMSLSEYTWRLLSGLSKQLKIDCGTLFENIVTALTNGNDIGLRQKYRRILSYGVVNNNRSAQLPKNLHPDELARICDDFGNVKINRLCLELFPDTILKYFEVAHPSTSLEYITRLYAI